MTLNTVTHKLTYAYNGLVLAEIKHVKGEKLYPYIMYVKEAYYPLELNYVEGPKGNNFCCVTLTGRYM